MRLLDLATIALLTGSLFLSSTAFAQQQGFALDRFDPADRGSEWFVLDSLDMRGHLRPAAGVVGAWGYKPLVAYDTSGVERGSLVEHQVFAHPGASVVLWSRLRAAVSMPIAVYQTGELVATRGKTYSPPASSAGDLRIASDVRLFGQHRGPMTGALGVAIHLPTGARADYTSDGNVRVTPRASIAGDISVLTYAARLGFAYRPLDEEFEQTSLGSEVTGSLALGARVADGKLVIGPEMFTSTIVDERSRLERRATPLEWLLGAHYTVLGLRFGAGVGAGVTRGWGTPALRAFASAEWTAGLDDDSDGDGVKDVEDACPRAAGVRASDPKTNGCPPIAAAPPPADRDGDGVVDAADACPNLAGVASEDRTKNGCPPDRDGDGVVDGVDACPDVPGAKSSDPAKDGCPLDRDGDGVADAADACPELPGERTKDPLSNGCPPDRDGDGVYDKEDACPDAPGPADSDPKHNGCPLARIEEGQIKIVEQVQFKTGSAELLPDSDTTLLAVATVLKTHPEITKIRIAGHTDDRGQAAQNRELSYRRALAVEKWLSSSGVDRRRLEAMGYGSARPLDSNATEEGRRSNRRVEFHIAAIAPSAAPSAGTTSTKK